MPEPTDDEYLEQLRIAYRDLAQHLTWLRSMDVGESQIRKSWDWRSTEDSLRKVRGEIERVSGETMGGEGEEAIATHEGGAPTAQFDLAAIHEPAVRAIAHEWREGFAASAARTYGPHAARYRHLERQASILPLTPGVLRDIVAQVEMQRAIIGWNMSDTFGQLMERFQAEDISGFEDSLQQQYDLDECFQREGIRGVGGSLGRQYKLEDHAWMFARTVGMKAMRSATVALTLELGWDTVIVMGGEMARTCQSCRQIDGKVLSISGARYDHVPNFWGSLADAYALDPPLGHPFCIHGLATYVDAPKLKPVTQEEFRKTMELASKAWGVDLDEESTTEDA